MAEKGFYVICALNNVIAHEDWMPMLLAAIGVPDVKEQLLKGMKVRVLGGGTHVPAGADAAIRRAVPCHR
jgi:hypothetical protein